MAEKYWSKLMKYRSVDSQLFQEMAEAVKEYGSQVLATHIRDLGETPRNKRYQDAIREDIAKAQAIIDERNP